MPNSIRRILKTLLILLVPVILMLGSARLLATDTYLAFEYGKASFPPDIYGFTPRQRFDLASTNIHYVRAHLPVDTLSSQTLDGKAVYNPREVSHMADSVHFASLAGIHFLAKGRPNCIRLWPPIGRTPDIGDHTCDCAASILCLASLV